MAQIMSDVFEAARREDVPGSHAARRSMELLGQLNTNGPGFTHARGPRSYGVTATCTTM